MSWWERRVRWWLGPLPLGPIRYGLNNRNATNVKEQTLLEDTSRLRNASFSACVELRGLRKSVEARAEPTVCLSAFKTPCAQSDSSPSLSRNAHSSEEWLFFLYMHGSIPRISGRKRVLRLKMGDSAEKLWKRSAPSPQEWFSSVLKIQPETLS